MKKLFFVLVFILLNSLSITAQEKTVNISKSEIRIISLSYSKLIKLETKDTLYYVHIHFRNAEYSVLSDYKSIFFYKKEDIKEFVDNIKTAKEEIENKQNISWKKELYAIGIYDFSKSIYIYESPAKGGGFTDISKKEADKLIKWLESFEFGKG